MTLTHPSPATTVEVLDPSWLSQALGIPYHDCGITRVTVVETLKTVATKIRFRIECERPPAGLPLTFCVKGMLDELDSILAGFGASVTEARFYQDCAPQLAIPIPKCFYAGVDKDRNQGLVLMEDKVAEGAIFLSALNPYSPDDAVATLNELAHLHAASWAGRPMFETAWIGDFLGRVASNPVIPIEMLQEHLDGPRGLPLPLPMRDARRLQSALGSLHTITRRRPLCIVHGDAHAGNLYHSDDGFGIVDWQIVQRGSWAQDVAYHIAAVLTPENRAKHERQLLRTYLEQLVSHGGPRISEADAWLLYRQSMLYGYYLWAITRKVDPVLTHEFVRRLGLAAAEHDSFKLVEA